MSKDDIDKSKEQLLRELTELRKQVESFAHREGGSEQRRCTQAEPKSRPRSDVSLGRGESAALEAAARGEPIPSSNVDSDTAEALLRCSPAAIVVLDRKGRVILWSPSAEQMFGWSEQEVLGKPVPIVPEEANEEFAQRLGRELEGENTVNAVLRRRKRDGTDIDLRLSTAPLCDTRGQSVGVIGLFTPAQRSVPGDASEAELGRLFDMVRDGVWVFDCEGVTTFVNRRMAEMIGYEVQEITGRPARDFVYPDDCERVAEIVRHRAEGIAESYELRLPHKQGGDVWCAVSGAPLHNREGEYVGALATVKDITERKQIERLLEQRVQERTSELTEANRRLREQIAAREQVERALRESEERFRLLAENATDLVCRHAPDGRYLYASPSCRRLLGYEPEELIGNTPYDIFHPDDVARVRETHERIMRTFEADAVEYRARRKDGSTIWLETMAKAIRSPETGGVIELHATSRDVTSRVKAEQQLRLVKCAVEQLDEMVVITEADLDWPGPRIVYVNPAFCSTTGYSDEEVIGRTPRILQGPRTSRPVLERLRKELNRGENFEGETYNYRKDGSEFILHWHITPLRDDAGHITHWVAIQRDVTEQRRNEALARQRQNELAHIARLSTMGEMASGLAHELNQPLAAIVIYVQGCLHRIRQSGMETHELVEALECVRGQAHRASEIIRRLRDFVQKREPQRSLADLNHLTREVLGLLEPEIQRHSVQLHLELDENLPPVMVDSVQIEQVILNLVRNAIEAMESVDPAKRHLNLSSYCRQDAHACICVRDQGVGMSEEQVEDIFKPFFTTKEEGMGMGLNISQSLTQANEGRLWAERNSDQGMSFCLSLPLAE